MSGSKHTVSLLNAPIIYSSELGSIRGVTAIELPILTNLSIQQLILSPSSIREPHWNTNANSLTYCLRGHVLISMLSDEDEFSVFAISTGEMFHVESGSLYSIENIGDSEAVFITAFRHEQPEEISLHAGFGAMSDAVLGNTYDLPSEKMKALKRTTNPKYIVKREGSPRTLTTAHLPNRHKFNIEAMVPPVLSSAGSAKTARTQFWPILQNISMYSLHVPDVGMREPHWHPETVELGYVNKGKARMSVMDPKGEVDTFVLGEGDCYFVEKGYPHQIECVEGEEIHFLIFFDRGMPEDVGFRTSGTSVSKEVFKAVFGVGNGEMPVFPPTVKDPLVVERKNPVDPVKSKL
jgi:oxalate decarboxylase